MFDREFWSEDRKFGLRISEDQVSYLVELCSQSKAHETGGILTGFYTEGLDCAVVTSVSRAPSDSQSGRAHFSRGIRGLQRWLENLWSRKRHYYLGEWHFHPFGSPRPSQTDIEQMVQIANLASYQCPEPVLIIIGGNPSNSWAMKAYVFPQCKKLIELVEDKSKSAL